MVEIRTFDERVQELFMQGLVPGTTHLSQGQEAVSVGAIDALDERDYLTVTYRCHGQALARGMNPYVAFAELMGRKDGCCKGLGGSMHLTDFSRGLLGAFAIVGAGLPVAVGAAMSARYRRSGQVALTFFGDGATNIGTFHESLNMASVWKAPVIFVIENNLYGEYTPIRETTGIDDLAVRASAFGMPGVIVDGQDVVAVHQAVSKAVTRARAGDGPTLVEAKTYRYRGHSRSDPARYRPPGELDRWKARDPIRLLGDVLDREGILSPSAQAAIATETLSDIDQAAELALESPVASLKEVSANVFAD